MKPHPIPELLSPIDDDQQISRPQRRSGLRIAPVGRRRQRQVHDRHPEQIAGFLCRQRRDASGWRRDASFGVRPDRVALAVEGVVHPLDEVGLQDLLKRIGVLLAIVAEVPRGHVVKGLVAELPQVLARLAEDHQRIDRLREHRACPRLPGDALGELLDHLPQETHAEVASPAKQFLQFWSQFAELLLNPLLAIALPLLHLAFAGRRERRGDIAVHEVGRHAEQLPDVLHHGQEVARRLVEHQRPLRRGQTRQARAKVLLERIGRRRFEHPHLDAVETFQHMQRVALARSRQFAPLALPVGDDQQQRPASLLGGPPDPPDEGKGLPVDPLRIVEPEHRGQAARPVDEGMQALAHLVDERLVRNVLKIFDAARARQAILRESRRAGDDLREHAAKGHRRVGDLLDRLAERLFPDRFADAPRRILPERAVVAQDLGMDRDRVPKLRQVGATVAEVPDLGRGPSGAEPREPGRALRHMTLHVGNDPQLDALIVKGVGPVVHLRWIPGGVHRQLLVERLHEATLPDAALGDDECRPRSANEATGFGIPLRAGVPQRSKPREFLLAAVEVVKPVRARALRTARVARCPDLMLVHQWHSGSPRMKR